MNAMSISEVCDVNPRLATVTLRGDDPVAFVGMAELDDVEAVATDRERRPYAEVAKGYTPFLNGDVLVAKITPCFQNNKIGVARTSTRHAFGSTEFHVLRPREDTVDRRYLLHFLRRADVLRHGEMRMTGAGGQRRVPSRFFDELQIPLPPIEEQRRIAAVLDTADDLRAKRREALAKLDTLTQAVFIDMFGDPVTNPLGWPSDRTLSDVADIRSGITKGRNPGDAPLTEVPYLAVANVQDGHLKLDNVKTIGVTATELNRYALRAGDVVLTEGGDPDKLGRGTIWHGDLEPCLHQNHIFRVRVTDNGLTPEYVSRLLGSQRGKRYFLRMAKQTTGIASINMTQLRGFPMLEPPLGLQQQFLDRVAAVERLTARGLESRENLGRLFSSLQQRAFRGEV